jgi:hypothetical protein
MWNFVGIFFQGTSVASNSIICTATTWYWRDKFEGYELDCNG